MLIRGAKKSGLVILLSILVIAVFPTSVVIHEFPVFRVVLDPGHGGRDIRPIEEYGDRYDRISGKYLEAYREGAVYKQYKEHILVYEIAQRVDALLQLAAPGGDFAAFYRIIQKYTDTAVRRVHINTFMSRPPSLPSPHGNKDPNAPYRLFDFIGADGSLKEGRISAINALHPHLVVSLHFALNTSPQYRGMNAVIAAPYPVLYQGLQYLQGKISGRSFFLQSTYADWFTESVDRTPFFWFCNDAALYFMGYRLDNDYTVNTNEFRGYRYNMVQWIYSDRAGWEHTAKHHPPYTAYSDDVKQFVPHNAFFAREQSIYESYRRDGGYEGYGGDNLYASNEIIRFVLYSLYSRGVRHKEQRLAPPYISTWSVPIHVNAINAFIELGYLARPYTRRIIDNHLNDISEGIAVGIYSLFAGIQVPDTYPYSPHGKEIDFKKYVIDNEHDYFSIVR